MAIPVVFIIFLFVLLLLFGANMAMVGLRRIARTTHTGLFTLSAVFLALTTSFPELSVAITSGLQGTSSLSFGNVLGANIANITLVSGGAAILAGRVLVTGKVMQKEIFFAGIAGIFPLILFVDGVLSRLDGFILIALWGIWIAHFFRTRLFHLAREFAREGSWYKFLHKRKIDHHEGREWVRFLLGVVVLLFSADMIVGLAQVLAQDVKIPLFLVGVFIVALGTTLPELAFSFKSIVSGEPTLFLGNILGSIITNSTLIVGIAGVLSPITVSRLSTLVTGMVFVLIYLLFWFFIRTKNRLDRWEAGILLGVYIIFVLVVSR